MKSDINEEIKKTKQLKEYARNMLCISVILLIVQIVYVLLNGRYYGTAFQKLIQFYFDKRIYLKARAIPLFVLVNLFGYFYNLIKLKKLSK